ncbi:MAG: hypothetical protein Q7R49_06335 [Candidatus Daviesbacteria bacterium]|nr:hypothetical protein [Candidatus Daviesbacteria bacterium]
MTEQLSEKQFNISPKTPHAWLASQERWGNKSALLTVADDIVANAMELEKGVNWYEILDRTFAIVHRYGINGRGDIRYTGKFAIQNSIAATVGSVASNMGWNMSSPEVVYMSGYHFFWGLGKDVDRLDQKIAGSNARTFSSEEAKEAALKKEGEEASRLGAFRKRLGETLDIFAQQNFESKNLDTYLKILRNLIYLPNKGINLDRAKVFALLKSGDIASAAIALGLS